MAYKPARERMSAERRSDIARHAALMRARPPVVSVCACGHAENEHWSVGSKECRTCDIAELPNACIGFVPR